MRTRNYSLNLKFMENEKKVLVELAKREGKTITDLIIDKIIKKEMEKGKVKQH